MFVFHVRAAPTTNLNGEYAGILRDAVFCQMTLPSTPLWRAREGSFGLGHG